LPYFICCFPIALWASAIGGFRIVSDTLVYSNIKYMLFEQDMLASELKSHLVDKLKDSAADGKTKSRA